MHNTSNTNSSSVPMDSLAWANRFVPLPPTQFPDEVAIHNIVKERPPVEPVAPIEGPANSLDLPCLQSIAGVDPFFTPAPTAPASNSSITAERNIEPADPDVSIPPQVEIVGQQSKQNPAPHADDEGFATPNAQYQDLEQQQATEVELVKNSGPQKPIVEIHEYDLATKVPTNSKAVDSRESFEVADGAASTEPDIAAYWSQDNVSSFMPGISPIEAYPVCQEYAEQISVSNDSESITLSDIELDQLLKTTASVKEDVTSVNTIDENNSQSTEATHAVDDAQAIAKPIVVPLQVDPFADETFESTTDVSRFKTTNQISKEVSIDNATAVTVSREENADDIASLGCLQTATPEYIAPEIPNLASRQVPAPADVPQKVTNETDQIDETSEATEDIVCDEPYSNGIFNSVEKSLSELQSVNHSDSNANFSPATDANELQSNAAAVPAEEIAEPEESQAEEQLAAVEEAPAIDALKEPTQMAGVTEPQPEPADDAQPEATVSELMQPATGDDQAVAAQPDVSAPTFEPLDLTAVLPAVQTQAAAQQLVESVVTQDTTAIGQTPEATSAMETVEQPAEPQEVIEEIQQTEEPADSQEPFEAESDHQVIEVDGNDGYDFLDLKAFDVAHATFLPGKIYLDDGTTKFQILYRNLALAVFADDFQVELS